MPFLSLLDDRAKPKGSRDPLGFELIWTHFGRQVIGNLTTITGSLSNFAVAIVGFKWSNDLHGQPPEAAEQQNKVRDAFLRYEQLAAYLRYLGNDNRIMGITRVQKRINEQHSRISFGVDARFQILSDQASYGLWGLYSSAMRDAGLITGDIRQPTSASKAILERIEHKIGQPQRFIDLYCSDKPVTREELKPLSKIFNQAIREKTARNDLMHILMKGGQHNQVQQQLWEITQAMAEEKTNIAGISRFIEEIKARSNDSELEQRLIEIERIERVLVAANTIFNYCRRKDGARIDSIAKELRRYSFRHLYENISFEDLRGFLGTRRVDIMQRFFQALKTHDQEMAVREVLDLNRLVMELRGGCPWVELENGITLRVKVASEIAELPDQDNLEKRWDYDYFIASYISIASQGLQLQWTTR